MILQTLLSVKDVHSLQHKRPHKFARWEVEEKPAGAFVPWSGRMLSWGNKDGLLLGHTATSYDLSREEVGHIVGLELEHVEHSSRQC